MQGSTIHINPYSIEYNQDYEKDSDSGLFQAILLHELQHNIQDNEGFGKAFSENGFEFNLDYEIEDAEDELESIKNISKFEPSYKEKIAPAKLKLKDLKEKRDNLTQEQLDDLYWKSSGEVEARNVMYRLNMSEEERRNSLLKETEDVAREDQIIIEDSFNDVINYISKGDLKISPQSPALISQEMADQISANLLTQLDRMIEERTNPSKVAEMLKSNKGLTKADIKDQVARLTEVKNQILGKGRVNYQGPRGALIEYAKNEMIMVALESPNVSTAIHELYHVFQGDLFPDEVQNILDSYNEAFGTNHTISDLKGKTAVDVEEWGARLWEKYFENGRKLTEKEVPNQKARNTLQNIFDKFTEWMKGVYNGVISYTNSQGATAEVNVSKPVQDMFDKILGITPIGEQTTQFSPGMEDLKFLKEMESFDFDNLNSACVRL